MAVFLSPHGCFLTDKAILSKVVIFFIMCFFNVGFLKIVNKKNPSKKNVAYLTIKQMGFSKKQEAFFLPQTFVKS